MLISRFRWSSENEADRFTVRNPATAEIIATIQGSGTAEVDAAVHAAHRAFHTDWRWRSGRDRGALLQEVARRLRPAAEEIAALEVRENGKTLAQARSDVEVCIASFDYFGGLAGKLPGSFFDGGPIYGATMLEPYGVVAAVIPFNWPPIHTGAKLAPALAVGNTVVVKPPEQTPLTILKIMEIVASVLPPDVIQALPGSGSTGVALVSHKLVRMISFTGSPATGAAVVKAAADNHTPLLMELGGKNAIIILEDADLDLALKGAMEAGFGNQGEACTAGSRLLVHRSRYAEAAERMSRAVSHLKVGSGMDAKTHVGPLISARQQERVLEYLRIGVAEGARVLAQASLPTDPRYRPGYFVAPTLLGDVKRQMRVAREEIFGPVVCMMEFETFEEAMSIANDTDFGLTSAVYTSNQATALAAARQLDVGLVFINNYFRGILGMPFGGTKASGYGREHSIETLKEFGRTKLITMVSGLGSIPSWAAFADVAI